MKKSGPHMEDDQFNRLFKFVRVIGSGSFGTVMHVVDKLTGEECAVKAISKSGVASARLDDLRKEAELLSTLDHPNIVKFLHVRETLTQVYLVMEIVYGGTLADYIVKRKISELEAAKAMEGVFRAVQYLHARGVIHRDLKPENILVGNQGDLANVKIADFGLSQQFKRDEINTSDDYCGTILFMAPEQLERKYYSKAVDIWSCGILMFMICNSGCHPLKEKTDSVRDYFEKLKSPMWKLEGLSPLGRNLFLRLVKHQPVERYSASQALMHPWVTRDSQDIPLTPFEQFRMYNDEIRLKKVFATQLLWGIFALGKLSKLVVLEAKSILPCPSQYLTESPVLRREVTKSQLPAAHRSYSVRIRRTSKSQRPTPQKAKPPLPKPALGGRKGARTPVTPGKPRVLRPITSSRRVNVSVNE